MRKQVPFVVTLLTVGAAAVVLGACGPKTVNLSDSGYDTSCKTDDDCVGVYFGNVCGFCTAAVPNAAINSSSEGAYQSALNAAESQCPPNQENGSCASASTITTCSMGKCTLSKCSAPPSTPHQCGATSVNDPGLTTACSSDTDCITVYFGDVCGLCPPSDNAAISASAQAAYQQDYSAAQMACPPQMGNGSCAVQGTVGISTCTMGTCQFQACPGSGPVSTPRDDLHACPSDAGAGDAGSD